MLVPWKVNQLFFLEVFFAKDHLEGWVLVEIDGKKPIVFFGGEMLNEGTIKGLLVWWNLGNGVCWLVVMKELWRWGVFGSVQYHLLFLSSLEYFPNTGPSFRHPGHLQSICLQTHPGAKGGRRVKEGWKMGSNSNNFEFFLLQIILEIWRIDCKHSKFYLAVFVKHRSSKAYNKGLMLIWWNLHFPQQKTVNDLVSVGKSLDFNASNLRQDTPMLIYTSKFRLGLVVLVSSQDVNRRYPLVD